MKRLLRIGIVSLAAAIVVFAAFHYMRAQGENSSSVFKAHQAAVASKTDDHSSRPVSHSLLTTYFNQFSTSGATSIAPGFDNPIDDVTTFRCPWRGCTLEIEQSVQMCDGSATGNRWAPLAQVDGTFTGYSPYVGEVPADGDCVLATSNQTTAVKPGEHTVQSLVYVDDAASLGSWHINYRVYIP